MKVVSVNAGLPREVDWRGLRVTTSIWKAAVRGRVRVEGLLEGSVRIGDRLRAGSAEFLVTDPRMPCYKLGVRFGRDDMVKRFLASGRTGFCLAVLREGEVAAGDPVELTARADRDVTVEDVVDRLRERSRGSDP